MRERIAKNILSEEDSALADACRRYLQWMKVKNYSPHTICRRYYGLNYFVYWTRERGLDQEALTSSRPIELFDRHLSAAGERELDPISPRYHFQLVHNVCKLYEYLVENGIIADNPAKGLKMPKLTKRSSPNVLKHEQVEAVLRQADIETWVGLRDRAILELIYSTGLRRQEVVDLTFDDVDLHAGVLCVRDGKGNKQRMVPVGRRATWWLSKYLHEVRPLLLQTGESESLFLTYKGTGFTNSGLANALTPYLRAAGYRGCCHVLRHSMATAMLENGARITCIQEILGHESLSSTQIYTHVSDGKLREVYDRTHPACSEVADDIPKAPAAPLYKWGGQPFSKKPAQRKTTLPPTSPLKAQAGKYLQAMAKEISPGTIDQRRKHLRRFIDWCEQRDIRDPHEVTHPLIERYHKNLYRERHQDRPLNPSYIGRHLISIRAFFAWLAALGIIPHNVAKKIRLPKRLKTIPHQVLTDDEIEKIFAQVNTTTPLGIRDRAILELLWATGMTTRELTLLTVEDPDFSQRTIHIRSTTFTPRTVPITTSAHNRLQIYLQQARPQLLRQPSPILFLGRYGPSLSTITLTTRVQMYFKKAGIQKPGNCRIFRHTLATKMLENGADIRHIQTILGHKKLSSTQIYTKVDIRKLKEEHRKTHPTASGHNPKDTSKPPNSLL